MKFLHLSDLHIGKSVNGFPMLAEQRHVFGQIIRYVETEQPDAVLIAGDVYDRAVPGVDAVGLFDDFLTELAGTGVHVLLIAGNHDSPERLNYGSRLLAGQKLHLCGVFTGKPQVVTLTDEFGPVNFWLLPFIKPSGVRSLYAGKDHATLNGDSKPKASESSSNFSENSAAVNGDGKPKTPESSPNFSENPASENRDGNEAADFNPDDESAAASEGKALSMSGFECSKGTEGHKNGIDIESYTDAVAAALAALEMDDTGRNVLVSHQFYAAVGIPSLRSESEINPVGGLVAVDAGILSRFDYVALGHLHGAQGVGGHIRYAGSPLKYSLSEWKQEKSATLVVLKEKGDIALSALPLTPRHEMREIKGPLERLLSEEIAAAGDREDYLRVVLTDEEEMIDPMGKIRSVYPNVMALDFENSRTGIDLAAVSVAAGELEKLSHYELFSEFFLAASGAVMTEEQARIVRELLEKEERE